MNETTRQSFERLIDSLRAMEEVRAIGKTGGAGLPLDGGSDVDIFLFCDAIPTQPHRAAALQALAGPCTTHGFGSQEGPYWGQIDFIDLQGLEICLMYFTIPLFVESIQAILRGERLDREGNHFYPTGRCASVLDMYAFYDRDGFLADLQRQLAVYPEALAQRLIDHHRGRLNDAEDFGRAVQRQDVLFYHATLDLAIDSFLQVLFALNRRFFPSRKRSATFVDGFATKPDDCARRLLRVVELGACPETLQESHRLWERLCRDLTDLIERQKT